MLPAPSVPIGFLLVQCASLTPGLPHEARLGFIAYKFSVRFTTVVPTSARRLLEVSDIQHGPRGRTSPSRGSTIVIKYSLRETAALFFAVPLFLHLLAHDIGQMV